MAEANTNTSWAGDTFGTTWMHETLIKMLRWIDVRIIYAFVAVFVVPVTLVVSPGARVIYHYFRRVWKFSALKSVVATYRNHYIFSQVIIDRFAIWSGKKYNITVEGEEAFQYLDSQPEGFVQLSAHVGNYEVAGYHLSSKLKRFNALVFSGEKATVMENRNRMFADRNMRMISSSADMSHIFELDNALTSGEIVSMPADRMLGSTKSVTKEFLGLPAKFPLGPFNIATMRGYNVIAVNVVKVKWNTYAIRVVDLPYDKEASRREQVAQLSEAYVRELERVVRKYPYQWFNFHEFWEEPKA